MAIYHMGAFTISDLSMQSLNSHPASSDYDHKIHKMRFNGMWQRRGKKKKVKAEASDRKALQTFEKSSERGRSRRREKQEMCTLSPAVCFGENAKGKWLLSM